MYVTNLYRHADTSFHQFQLGILEKERLDQMLQIFVDALREFWPAQVIWNARSTNGNNIPEFEEYVSSYTRSRGAWEPVCAEVSGVTRMLT
ncbi:MAG: hypothetical protein KDA77_11525 [Planctomycetaceae bacterium]|nr:hypothetical protein [Planctomycetaceae bacterium]